MGDGGPLLRGSTQDVANFVLHASRVPLRPPLQLLDDVILEMPHDELSHQGRPRRDDITISTSSLTAVRYRFHPENPIQRPLAATVNHSTNERTATVLAVPSAGSDVPMTTRRRMV